MNRPSGQPGGFFHWIAFGAVVAGMAAGQLLETSSPGWLRGVGLAALAVSLPLFVLPFAHLGRYGAREPGKSYMDTTRVADRGVYALVRHPQYLGYSLLVVGLALVSLHWVTVALAALAVSGFRLQARGEERDLIQRMGEPYAEYVARVPGFNLLKGVARWMRSRRLTP